MHLIQIDTGATRVKFLSNFLRQGYRDPVIRNMQMNPISGQIVHCGVRYQIRSGKWLSAPNSTVFHCVGFFPVFSTMILILVNSSKCSKQGNCISEFCERCSKGQLSSKANVKVFYLNQKTNENIFVFLP